jgi:4-hydroxy-3-methylbut-2-enyl diphosphate reductase
MSNRRMILASPRGFCAGVDRAIEIVEKALHKYGKPIYVRHEIVHNRFVVESLKEKGAIFIDELDQAPDGAIVIFSAHGVPLEVQNDAVRRKQIVYDATCPLVKRVHRAVIRGVEAGRRVILIGHAGHPEVIGTLGQIESRQGGEEPILLVESVEQVAQLDLPSTAPLSFVTQTTLSVDDSKAIIDALKARFSNIERTHYDDICYATQNRQDALKLLAKEADLILVVGSKNSSNSNRLREIAEDQGVPSYLIDHAGEIDPDWLVGKRSVGVTAGASAPEYLVEELVSWFEKMGFEIIEQQTQKELVSFSIPEELNQTL